MKSIEISSFRFADLFGYQTDFGIFCLIFLSPAVKHSSHHFTAISTSLWILDSNCPAVFSTSHLCLHTLTEVSFALQNPTIRRWTGHEQYKKGFESSSNSENFIRHGIDCCCFFFQHFLKFVMDSEVWLRYLWGQSFLIKCLVVFFYAGNSFNWNAALIWISSCNWYFMPFTFTENWWYNKF